MPTGIAGTLGLTGTQIEKIYEDAVHVDRELNVLKALVEKKTDRHDTLPRQYNMRPKLEAGEVAEYDDYANPQKFDNVAGNIVTPSDKISQVFVTDDRRRDDPDVGTAVAFEMGEAMALKGEIALLELLDGFERTQGTANTKLTWADLRQAEAKLNTLGHRMRRKPTVLDEWQWYELAREIDLDAAAKNTADSIKESVQNAWYRASVGMLDFYVTANTKKVGDGGDAVGGMFVRDAILFDERVTPYLEPERDASRRGDELNMVEKYGIGLWRPNAGITLLGDVAEHL